MKINFDASYRELKRVVDSQAGKAERKGEDFSKLLGSISPTKAQEAKLTRNSERSQGVQIPESQMRARYTFPEPTTKLPVVFETKQEASATLNVKELPEEVITAPTPPRILKARRVSNSEADRLDKLPISSRVIEIKELVQAAGKRHAVDPVLGMAVVSTESSFNPYAVSADGYASKGLFQLLDSTGKDMRARLDISQYYNPFNPSQNVELGVGYLRYLHDIFSQDTELPNKMRTIAAANSSSLEKLAVAAFNAGEGRVASAQQRAQAAGKDPAEYDNIKAYLPDITQKYVDKVLLAKGTFEGRFVD